MYTQQSICKNNFYCCSYVNIRIKQTTTTTKKRESKNRFQLLKKNKKKLHVTFEWKLPSTCTAWSTLLHPLPSSLQYWFPVNGEHHTSFQTEWLFRNLLFHSNTPSILLVFFFTRCLLACLLAWLPRSTVRSWTKSSWTMGRTARRTGTGLRERYRLVDWSVGWLVGRLAS